LRLNIRDRHIRPFVREIKFACPIARLVFLPLPSTSVNLPN